jgi:hypothetical protein
VNGWVLGYIIGGVVVAVVVVVLLLLIRSARRTAQKAEAIASALRVAHTNSSALHDLENVPLATGRVRQAAAEARSALENGGPA